MKGEGGRSRCTVGLPLLRTAVLFQIFKYLSSNAIIFVQFISWCKLIVISVVDPNLLNLDPDPELVIQSILKEKIQNNLRKIIFHETSTVYFF